MDAGRSALYRQRPQRGRPVPVADGGRHAALPRVPPARARHARHRPPRCSRRSSARRISPRDSTIRRRHRRCPARPRASPTLGQSQFPARTHLRARGSRISTATCPAPKTGRNGRHPLPDRAAFARRVRRAGHRRDGQVVAYDPGRRYAARLWWLLRWLGHDAVAGARRRLAAGTRAGGPLTPTRRRCGGTPPLAADATRRSTPTVASPAAARRRRGRMRSCSMHEPASVSAVKSSRSTRSPGTSPARSTASTRTTCADGRFKPPAVAARRLRGAAGDTRPGAASISADRA